MDNHNSRKDVSTSMNQCDFKEEDKQELEHIEINENNQSNFDPRLNPNAPDFVPRFQANLIAAKIFDDMAFLTKWSNADDDVLESCGPRFDSIWRENCIEVLPEDHQLLQIEPELYLENSINQAKTNNQNAVEVEVQQGLVEPKRVATSIKYIENIETQNEVEGVAESQYDSKSIGYNKKTETQNEVDVQPGGVTPQHDSKSIGNNKKTETQNEVEVQPEAVDTQHDSKSIATTKKTEIINEDEAEGVERNVSKGLQKYQGCPCVVM